MNLSEQELINDLISSQKMIDSAYNTFTNECANTNLRNSFLNILKEEHEIQADLFTEASNRGWYAVKQADQNMVSQAKQKFTGVL